MQSKNNHLRPVTGVDHSSIEDDFSFEADKIEALNGPNPYSNFLRKHGRWPSREQAFAIGKLMAAKVRASDGTMQPEPTAVEKAALRAIRKRRKEWAQQVEHIQTTVRAIAALGENQQAPSTVFERGVDIFTEATLRKQIDSALSWLERFAKELHHHDKGSCAPGPQLVGGDLQSSPGRRLDD